MVAVVYVLVDNGRVLVEERQEGKFKGRWLYPTEKIEEGETPDEALYRGLREELGVAPRVSYHLGMIDNDWGYPAYVYVVLEWEPRNIPDHILDDNHNKVDWKDVSFMTASDLEGQREITNRLFRLMTSTRAIDGMTR